MYIHGQYMAMKYLQDPEGLGSKLYILLSVFLLQNPICCDLGLWIYSC